MLEISVIKDDITTLNVDAIVNAANKSLAGGGGVDGAIHRAAGPELKEATKKYDGCATGDSKVTKGFDLPADYVIHAVGPVWNDGNSDEDELLASAYESSLKNADSEKCKTIAFPNISTGIYGFPKERAANIAINTVQDYEPENLEEVIFCCFDDENFDIYKKILND
ncbi:O-acetyl-ADP-ribose deacetylase [Mangrovivirga cuniculi]|uniref:O-acetyl-ADP-ribose deacetylase n=1 Tax=Mangrovivirga cuniculi TaxID=2715131 RepID=A0A4D7JEJ5_9BACT|nr:O-acetyl-ADP-ribose deacetylase [Mangrovivirga cuniculi]QCK14659.1 O-acetyl-ADP-ribose deacetylase [Mangrovivirga cuniculi]